MFYVTALAPTAVVHAEQREAILNSDYSQDNTVNDRLDSLQSSFYRQVDSLKQSYRTRIVSLDSAADKVQAKIDSLKSFQLVTEKYTFKLDSINRQKYETISAIDRSIDTLREQTVGLIKKFDVPPELKDKASSFTSSIEGFKLLAKDMNIHSLDLPDSPLKDLDGLNTPIVSPIESLNAFQDVESQLGDISSIATEANDYQKDVQNVTQGSLKEIQHLPEMIEGKAIELAGVDKLQEQANILNPLLNSSEDTETLKKKAIEQGQQMIVEHFAGQKEQLNQAMEQISKLKQKYSSVKTLSEISKKCPNEIKGKYLNERLLPGIAFQILKNADDFMTDFNPYIGYRFTGRLKGGLGWNQRVTYNYKKGKFTPEAGVYGPRIFAEYNLGKGFMPRGELEVLNTFLPPFVRQITTDNKERDWVPGIFLGLKKEFRFIRKVKGTSMIMARLYNPHHKSPYADVVNVRFGFEFPMKKRKIERTVSK